jgi:hypothetical protein
VRNETCARGRLSWLVLLALSCSQGGAGPHRPAGMGGMNEPPPEGGSGGASAGAGGGAGGGSGGGGGTAGSSGTGGTGGAASVDTGAGGRSMADAAADTRADAAPPSAGTGGSGPAPGMGPIGKVGASTFCLNADGPGGKASYDVIDSVLGANAVEHNPDMDHSPPFQHVKEEVDDEVGPHFVFYAHYPTDNDGAPGDDRSRIEIKVNGGADDLAKGTLGETMTYTWRFKMNAEMGFSNRFSHVFQMKSFGGNDGAPIITLTGSGTGASENLRVDYWTDTTETTTVLARTPMAGLKGVWLSVQVRAEISQSGAFSMTVKKPDGTAVISIDTQGLDLWRQGEYVRGKWGIYRGKSEQLRTVEETVRFANFGITAGATPTSDCRAK